MCIIPQQCERRIARPGEVASGLAMCRLDSLGHRARAVLGQIRGEHRPGSSVAAVESPKGDLTMGRKGV